MNNETRLRNLFTYLDGLANLAVSDYRCNNEIAECIGWIREELQKEPDTTTEVSFNGVVIARD